MVEGLNAPTDIAVHDGWLYIVEFCSDFREPVKTASEACVARHTRRLRAFLGPGAARLAGNGGSRGDSARARSADAYPDRERRAHLGDRGSGQSGTDDSWTERPRSASKADWSKSARQPAGAQYSPTIESSRSSSTGFLSTRVTPLGARSAADECTTTGTDASSAARASS